MDFCNPVNAYLIPARKQFFSQKKVDGLETVNVPWLAEPDQEALRDLMRHVLAHPEERRIKGQAACDHIREHFRWDQAVAIAEERLLRLRQQPVRREHKQALDREPPVPPDKPMNVSLCMIVKNVESCIGKCLGSVADLVDEMIVVDTGSTDRTREVASQLGARVLDFTWVDSFAAARNESFRHARGEWILWPDADEWFDEQNRQRLRQLLANLPRENVALLMCQYSQLEHGPHTVPTVDHPRLFRNHHELRWTHRVHEQILPSLRQLGAQLCKTDIRITHDGFADPSRQQAKIERNRRLLELELSENPTDAFVLFNLGAVALGSGQADRALAYLGKSLETCQPSDTLFPKAHALTVRAHHQLGCKKEALAACCAALELPGLDNNAELLFWKGILCRERGELAEAEALSPSGFEHFPPARLKQRTSGVWRSLKLSQKIAGSISLETGVRVEI
jgi:hypothetical protein